MSNKKKKRSKASKTQTDKQVSLQIYARVRCLMPWEPEKVSLKIDGLTKLRNKSRAVTNEYTFSKVFNPKQDNKLCFDAIVMPMIANVLMGYNAVLIAYGQTGSGKTYSMLGKPKLGIVGILPMMLEFMVKQPTVKSVQLSAIEAFGHHIAKIHLYDLFEQVNQNKNWTLKKGDTSLEAKNAINMPIKDANDAHDKIIFAHAGSHFAPTGKNPESSRGHVTFISKISQSIDHKAQVSYFVMIDCAGSEGESAFTKAYIKSVDKPTLMARRLEAGCINTGLSALQIIFNELRLRGKLSNSVGNGLRRVLHPYINTKTYLSVLFCLSPSVNNSRATEATLKFAVTAGMVKVSPIASKKVIDFDSLVDELNAHIKAQEDIIEENNDKAEKIQNELNAIKVDIVEAYEEQERKKQQIEMELAEKEKEMKQKEKNMNEKDKNDFMQEIIRQRTSRSNISLSQWNVQTFDHDNDSQSLSLIGSPLSKSGHGSFRQKHRTLTLSSSQVISLDIEPHERVVSQVPAAVQLSLAALEKQQEDEAVGLYSIMTDEYGDVMDPLERIKIAQEKKDAPKVIENKENELAMQVAINEHEKLQHNANKTVTEFAKNDLNALLGIDVEEEERNMKEYEYPGNGYDEYLRLKSVEYKKLEKDELNEYADEQWLFYQQEVSVKKNLQQSTNVITDYLQEEFEGLLSFFRIRKILPKHRIDIQWDTVDKKNAGSQFIMALTLQNTVQNTTDRFAKSTQHLISHLSKSFGGKNKDDINEAELSDEENAIRCQINFQRLLYKTLELVENIDVTIPNPHHPPLLIRIQQYYKSLQSEFKMLKDFENNQHITNIKFSLLPQYQSKLNIVKNWIVQNQKIQNKKENNNYNDNGGKNNQTQEIIDNINNANNKNNQNNHYKKDWRLRKRRRIMRFSEKLTKEYQEKRLRNLNENKNDDKKSKNTSNDELSEREALIEELENMTKLLKGKVIGLRETLKEDEKVMKDLDEETYGTLDKVTALNDRMKKYVEATSGMTCTMCLMMFTVILTWIWGFFVIYFV